MGQTHYEEDGGDTWQPGVVAAIAVCGPAISTAMVFIALYGPDWVDGRHSFDAAANAMSFLFVFLPAGFIFGLVPALVAGSIYAVALTFLPSLRDRVLLRCAGAAATAAMIGGAWCSLPAIDVPLSLSASSSAISGALLAALFPGPKGSSSANYRLERP